MLAGSRYCFLLSFVLVFSVAACVPTQAQINGVPASVTSLGFGGHDNPNPGVRASVTSLGPNGYGNSRPAFGNWGYSFFLPVNPNPPLSSGRHRHHGEQAYFGVEPVYIPYAVPYVQEADDDDSADDYVRAPDVRTGNAHAKRAEYGDPAPRTDAAPVAAQPSTVLVFKDGHHSDVFNYAIVGDTLFDFSDGRARKILLADIDLPATQRANDDRGVDFQIPAQ